jgi:hypothetical protein
MRPISSKNRVIELEDNDEDEDEDDGCVIVQGSGQNSFEKSKTHVSTDSFNPKLDFKGDQLGVVRLRRSLCGAVQSHGQASLEELMLWHT